MVTVIPSLSKPISDKVDTYSVLFKELVDLQRELESIEPSYSELLQQLNVNHLPSAINMIHYLGLRQRDIRPLQRKLATVGLSSLGRTESHVLSSLQAMIVLLQHALGKQNDKPPLKENVDASMVNPARLKINTDNLLGHPPAQRNVRILVTLPGEAADEYELIKEMLLQGMDCARINCAHDTPAIWTRMIENIKLAKRETGRHCSILMDLGGPKLRTGEIALAPAVMKWRPVRNIFGKITSPARVWLHPETDIFCGSETTTFHLPIKDDFLVQAKVNNRIEFTDARGAHRVIQLVEQVGKGFWAESNQTSYLVPDVKLHLLQVPTSGHPRRVGTTGKVGELPPKPVTIRLQRGDSLILTRDPIDGCPAHFDENENLLSVASIACSSPEVFESVRPGERILLDDGKIGGVIRSVSPDKMQIEITHVRDGGEKLLADKGINLPDSQLELAGLTSLDIEHLEFVVRHADMVGLSFVRRPEDVILLQQHLKRLDAEKLGIVIKIETRAAFEQLPKILFALMRSSKVGIMIARGDLAVECGYERLAELQEEIMWLAESAHLPVIWATQVLEGLAKSGIPSRAEVTDAAMGERAECVMLNKGPHIIEAIQMLDNILQRMQGHQQKKSALLRRLHWQIDSRSFLE